jgi:hypothetical protein
VSTKLTTEERVKRLLCGRDEPKDVPALDRVSVEGRLIIRGVIDSVRGADLRIRQLEAQLQTLKRRMRVAGDNKTVEDYGDNEPFTPDELGIEVEDEKEIDSCCQSGE